MLNRLNRPISRLKQVIGRLLTDDAGTAAVLAPQYSVGRAFPAIRAQLFAPTTARVALGLAGIGFQQLPAIRSEGNHSVEYQAAKRAIDIIGALVLLFALSPILLTVLIVLAITTQGKPLFCQERVGHCGRRFRMYKFRTMRLDADKFQHLVQNEKDGPIFKNRCDPRVTKLGRWLRKTSIDEMPQLVSVLLGDMSLVGPRPPVPKEVARYKAWQRRRLAVKPGLTCLWQVSGRSDVGFEDWVRMDIWYLRHQNLWTDIKLLVRTPLKVITCKGAY